MNQTRKDIFGNEYKITEPKKMSYAQKLREAKAKQKYKEYMAQKRQMQINNLKRTAQRSGQGLANISRRTRTATKKSGLKSKLYYAVKGRDKSIYKKE